MDKVTISNLQGENGIANVVRYFLNNGSEYLIYSLNEVDEAGYTRLYVAKITGVDGMYNAETLNDTEWNEIKNLVKVIVKANKENLPVPVQDINPNKIKNIVLKDKKIFKLNTPLVNDLSANKPNFGEETADSSTGEQKNAFDIPNTQSYEAPVQPTFDIPSTQSYEAPVQPTFDIPNTQSYETPVQPTFDIPNTQSYEAPVQPTFDIPSTQSYETPVQPTFDISNTQSYEAPVQPTFDIPSTQSYETPVQPTFEVPTNNSTNFGTFDFGATNAFTDTQIPTNNENQIQQSTAYLQDEINRLNEELAKYKAIVDNIKDLIEK